MRFIKIIIFLLLPLIVFLYSCQNSNPIKTKNEKQIELEFIPPNQVIINWDSTVYQHIPIYSHYDSSYVDSLANTLKNSIIPIEDMWFPNQESECMPPIIAGREIIIKLSNSDTLIYRYGFQKNEGNFLIGCYREWRHYKFILK